MAAPAASPEAVIPPDLFPAPPGFSVSSPAPGTWRLAGEGTASEAASWLRTTLVELYGWKTVAESRETDGSWRLEFVRGPDRLRARVSGSGGTADCLVERNPNEPHGDPSQARK
ncbi:MAG: hypothetical protein L0216_10785 [Planctomycetales bacterium]|nr:hypothetical protein [Planctomycetales bacterium]